MPFPDWLARFNRHVTNPILGVAAGRVPPLVMLEHVGRTSGRRHHTPVLGFWDAGVWIVPLVYGSGTDWQRNLEAAGKGVLIANGTRFRVGNPRVVNGEPARNLPRWVGPAIDLIDVDEYLILDAL